MQYRNQVTTAFEDLVALAMSRGKTRAPCEYRPDSTWLGTNGSTGFGQVADHHGITQGTHRVMGREMGMEG